MILRRLTKHVNHQNWFAVALDFLIVVVGILIAFQITNWNDARRDRSDQAAYLERLAGDLDLTITTNENYAKDARAVAARTARAVDMLEQCSVSVDAKDDFASALYLAGRLNMPILVTNTIDELSGAGRGGLIDPELRAALNDLLELQKRADENRSSIETWTAPKVALITRSVRFRVSDNHPPSHPISADEATFDLAVLCGDDAFINALAALGEYARIIAISNELRVTRPRDVRRMVSLRLAGGQQR
jgi:hypothetical protein